MRRKTARIIAPHISALRRYARALDAKDAARLVRKTLDAVDKQAYRQLPERDVRLRLFRDFHDVHARAKPHATAAQKNSHGLMLRYSQGFSIQDVAAILRCDAFNLQARLAGAYRDLHEQASSDVLVVEDDPVLANGLVEMIESLGHRVLGVARTQDEAVLTASAVRLDALVVDMDREPIDRQGKRNARSGSADQLLRAIGVPIVVVLPQVEVDDDGPAYAVGTPFQSAELKVMLSQALTNR